ncbi:hypothetical protein QQS21_007800 [Conoideocrella luteorostrata]|uniref:Uncharacterized protein n=1 Tax=Conoideocrella luteorostrata TaxID=1105319 RepID=A0AAJ0CK88_9HYPO|nr:hypothetical protein QQS21_007800 [Conoideocrella luteorostrata]
MEPPSYDEVVANDAPDDFLHSPATFHLTGRLIYSDKNATEPLYELSQDIAFVRDSTQTVSIERTDFKLKVSDNGMSHMATLRRPIYALKHPPVYWSPLFLYHADPASKLGLCAFGLSTFRPKLLSLTPGFRVHRAARDVNEKIVQREELFSAVPMKRGTVKFEWSDAEGRIIARELDRPDGYSLFITRAMNVKTRDALVSAWVLRLWWEVAGSTRHYEL